MRLMRHEIITVPVCVDIEKRDICVMHQILISFDDTGVKRNPFTDELVYLKLTNPEKEV